MSEPSAAAVAPLAATDFPRGGGSVLTPIEYRQAAQSRPEAELGGREPRKRARSEAGASASRKRGAGSADGADAEGGRERRAQTPAGGKGSKALSIASLGAWTNAQAPQRVDPLSFKRVHEGMRVLGIVRDVHDTSLVVALPNNLSGRVPYEHASDRHSALWAAHAAHAAAEGGAAGSAPELPALGASFHVGDLVRCVVVAVVRKGSKGAKGAAPGAQAAPLRKGITLTLCLSRLQPALSAEALAPGAKLLATVQSIEEHGAILALGPAGLSGFLHADRIAAGADVGPAAGPGAGAAGAPQPAAGLAALQVGRVLLCAVAPGARRGGVLPLSYDPAAEASTLTLPSDSVTLGTLLPGALVSARVAKAVSGGLLVSVLEFFAGTIELLQLPELPAGADWSGAPQLAPGAKLRARILFVDAERKTVALAARRELVLRPSPASALPGRAAAAAAGAQRAEGLVGARVEATVVAAVPKLGVVARATLERAEGEAEAAPSSLPAFAPLSHLTDELGEALDKKASGSKGSELLARASARALGSFAPGGAPRAGRIVGYSWLEGAYLLSFKKSGLARGVVAFGALRPGEVREGTVKKLGEFGAIVSLGPGVDGLVARDHLGAGAKRQLAKRAAKGGGGGGGGGGALAVGDAVSACVLSVDAGARKLTLSLLRELVRSTHQRLAAYGDAVPGLITHGVVTGVKPFGCVVSFFAGVRGVVRAAELRATHGDVWDDDPKACYALGQPVRVRVVSAEPAKERLCVSFVLDPAKAAAAAGEGARADGGADGAAAEAAGGAAAEEEEASEVREGSVVSARVASVLPDRYSLTLEGGLAERAELPFAQCCDIAAHAEPLGGAYAPGDVLPGLLVVGASGGRRAERVLSLSGKHSLLVAAAAGELPTAASALAPGRTLGGFVHALAPYGAFVRFGSADASLLVPKRELADAYVTEVAERVAIGQSVRVHILPPADGSARPVGSLRHAASATAETATLLLHALALEKAALAAAARFDPAGACAPGALLRATVLEHKPYGLVLALPDGSTGFVARAHVAPAAPPAVVDAPASAAKGAGKAKAKGKGKAEAAAAAAATVGAAAAGVAPPVGSAVDAVVLDSDAARAIVDCSLRAELVRGARERLAAAAAGVPAGKEPGKKRKKGAQPAAADDPAPPAGAGAGAAAAAGAPAPGTATTAIVELVRAEYAVVSLPQHANAIGFALTAAFNEPRAGAPADSRYALGQAVSVVVAPPPPVAAAAAGARAPADGRHPLLLRLARVQPQGGAQALGAEGRRPALAKLGAQLRSLSDCRAGMLVKVRVIGKTATQLNVRLAKSLRARVHLSEAADAGARASFDGIADDATLLAVVIGADSGREIVELSIKPSEIAAAKRAARGAAAALAAAADGAAGEAAADGAAGSGAGGAGAPRYAPRERPTVESLAVGEVVDAVVREAGADYLWLFVGPHVTGRAFCLELGDDPALAADPRAHFATGDAVRARVLASDRASARVDLSLRLTPAPTARSAAVAASAGVVTGAPDLPAEGAVVLGRLSKVLPAVGAHVQLSPTLHGRAHLTELEDGWPDAPTSGLHVGAIVRAVVVHVDAASGQVDLSLRPEAVAFALRTGAPPPPRLAGLGALARGERVCAYAKRTDGAVGVFVTLSRGVDALIPIAHLSDDFLPTADGAIAPGSLVRARVLSVDAKRRRVALTTRPSLLVEGAELPEEGAGRGAAPSGAAAAADGLASLEEGAVVSGVVRRVEKFGVFVQLDNAPLSGLAHLSELTGKYIEDPAKLYRIGERVQAIVLSVDIAAKRVSLSLRAELLRAASEAAAEARGAAGAAGEAAAADEEEEEEGDDEGTMVAKRSRDVRQAIADEVLGEVSEDEDEEEEEGEGGEEEEDDDGEEGEEEASEDEEEEEEEDDDDDDVVTMKPAGGGGAAGGAGAALAGGFEWDDFASARPAARAAAGGDGSDGAADAAGGGEGESRDADRQRRARKEARRAGAAEGEAALQARERALADGSAAPVSADDFERLLAAAPDSAYVWVKFMAFQLSLADVERARAIGDRALKSISYRKLDEKKNVWIALLNLEKAHGTAESLAGAFKRACADQNAKHMYLQMATVHERAGDGEAVSQTFDAACKHYKASKKVWLAKMDWQMRAAKPEAAKATLERALQSLARRKHVATIVKFAQLEYRHGSLERARTVLDGVMEHHPKRLDLWSVYLDMETRKGAGTLAPDVRRLFERVSSLKLSSKKMKYVLKRWLDWEAAHGDVDTMAAVKQRAREYVQLKAGGDLEEAAAVGADAPDGSDGDGGEESDVES